MNGVGVEILVYIYLAVCVSMILFNIGTIIVSKKRDKYDLKKEISTIPSSGASLKGYATEKSPKRSILNI